MANLGCPDSGVAKYNQPAGLKQQWIGMGGGNSGVLIPVLDKRILQKVVSWRIFTDGIAVFKHP
jgi:hypothetical protein